MLSVNLNDHHMMAMAGSSCSHLSGCEHWEMSCSSFDITSVSVDIMLWQAAQLLCIRPEKFINPVPSIK